MVISWGTYLTWWFVIAGLYYATIFLLFFRKGVKVAGGHGATEKKKKTAEQVLFRSAGNKENEQLDAATAAPMHSLVDELQAYISQAGKQDASKEEVSASLKNILQKYPAIKGSLFQEGITNLIAVISENNCGIHFSADELSELWMY